MNIISQFNSLNYQQQRDLLQQLQQTLSSSRPILEHRHLTCCPHCECEKVYKHANYKNGGSRFKCTNCKKTFNELTGTSLHGIHKKEQWDGFIKLMLESKTVRQISKELGIDKETALHWRHKALSAFNDLYTKRFKGVVETDDTYFRINQKGSRNVIYLGRRLRGISNQKISVMITADRYKSIDLTIIKRGKLTTGGLKKKMDLDRFNKSNIIYSDSAKAIENFFTYLGIQHETFVAEEKYSQDGKVHVQTVNNITGRLKNWIKLNFNNVSTKYLHNYLNWFMMLEVLKGQSNKEDKMWDYLMKSTDATNEFKNIDNNYHNLINSKL